MKRIFPFFLLLLLLTACMENRPVRIVLEQAAALMDTRPDSALGILLALPKEDSAATQKGVYVVTLHCFGHVYSKKLLIK